jgi:hypothetical protein
MAGRRDHGDNLQIGDRQCSPRTIARSAVVTPNLRWFFAVVYVSRRVNAVDAGIGHATGDRARFLGRCDKTTAEAFLSAFLAHRTPFRELPCWGCRRWN